MTNPFKIIAPALGARGALFVLLGLILVGRAVPTLLSMQGVPDIAAAVIGIFLLTVGVVDLVRAAQRMTRLRTEKLDFTPIDYMYTAGSGGERIPPRLMAADENPNETNQADMIEWIARVVPKVAFVPRPYTGALHAVLIAFLLGVLGVVALLALRVLLAGSTTPPQLASIIDWSLWFYFLLGFGFWAAISRFGFRRALHFEGNLRGGRMVGLFVILLGIAIAVTASSSIAGEGMPAPPDLGALTTILILGSLGVIVSTALLVLMRGRRAPDHYSVHRDEEFFTVGMHPTDMINVIKSYTGKMAGGAYMHLGSWKPQFSEHTAVSAGEFEADLNAESGITLNDAGTQHAEKRLGTLLAWIGLAITAASGFFLFRAASVDWSTSAAVADSFALPAGLLIFGALFYRLGLIPIAELEWTSVLTNCAITGTFQTQGGMALMQAGEHSIKGSVLTSATVQPRCAYLKSVGFFLPGAAKQRVARLVDQVDPAQPVAKEILTAIHNQARQMMAVGAVPAAAAAAGAALPDKSGETLPEGGDGERPSTH